MYKFLVRPSLNKMGSVKLTLTFISLFLFLIVAPENGVAYLIYLSSTDNSDISTVLPSERPLLHGYVSLAVPTEQVGECDENTEGGEGENTESTTTSERESYSTHFVISLVVNLMMALALIGCEVRSRRLIRRKFTTKGANNNSEVATNIVRYSTRPTGTGGTMQSVVCQALIKEQPEYDNIFVAQETGTKNQVQESTNTARAVISTEVQASEQASNIEPDEHIYDTIGPEPDEVKAKIPVGPGDSES
ncbi:hypothetical protein B566_EDAN004953, partial [Ephemera danica]